MLPAEVIKAFEAMEARVLIACRAITPPPARARREYRKDSSTREPRRWMESTAPGGALSDKVVMTRRIKKTLVHWGIGVANWGMDVVHCGTGTAH